MVSYSRLALGSTCLVHFFESIALSFAIDATVLYLNYPWTEGFRLWLRKRSRLGSTVVRASHQPGICEEPKKLGRKILVSNLRYAV